MPRRLRYDVPRGYYHVASKGNGDEPVFLDDEDRSFFLSFLGRTALQHEWRCFSYVLMTNHYHLVLQIGRRSLGQGMQRLNGTYASFFNGHHHRLGHVFGGRYRVSVIDGDKHLAEACRYVVCNPVRAGICSHPGEWPWSSYRATVGDAPRPPFLDVDAVVALFGGSDAYRAAVEESLPTRSRV